MRRPLLAVFLLVAGCAVGAPAATPSPAGASPSAPPTSAPTATAAPIAAATATSGAGYSCDPDMSYYGCDEATATPGSSPAPTAAGNGLVVSLHPGPNPYLVGPNDMTLYTNSNDSADHSSCGTGCQDSWPPLTGESATGDDGVAGTFATLVREDGSTQVTYNGMPLYYYAGDSAAGDTNGDGAGGVWYLARP